MALAQLLYLCYIRCVDCASCRCLHSLRYWSTSDNVTPELIHSSAMFVVTGPWTRWNWRNISNVMSQADPRSIATFVTKSSGTKSVWGHTRTWSTRWIKYDFRYLCYCITLQMGKQYPCSYCGKILYSSQYVKKHEATHTGQKFKAVTCKYCFKTVEYTKVFWNFHDNSVLQFEQFQLKNHELIHTGEKPFACSDCSYRCIQRSNLRIHMRAVHKKELPRFLSIFSMI